jgi:hypothetical protein
MAGTASAIVPLGEQRIRRFHLQALVTAGTGVFTDGYDLSSIVVVLPMVLASFGIDHVSDVEAKRGIGPQILSPACGRQSFSAAAARNFSATANSCCRGSRGPSFNAVQNTDPKCGGSFCVPTTQAEL